MTVLAFTDGGDGYYQIDVADGESLPAWASGLTPCAVRQIVPTASELAALAKAAQDLADVQDARDDALVQAIAAMTPAELVQHIDTTFPSMTVAQRRVLKVLSKMARISANRL